MYRGRFAPSPTGPLHAGSIMAALASFLDARSHHGRWLVRMEDLDPPRESPAAASQILHDLEALGLHWDEPVLYQSQRHAAYADAIEQLDSAGHTFWCDCTRQVLSTTEGRYPGTCRERGLTSGPGKALRCRVSATNICFIDQLQGQCSHCLQRESGDFIIKRKDGFYAYQLAVVVDDAWQGITHVMRGIDLLDSTPRQIHLQALLSLATPQYAHIPVLVHADGQKLSKQSFAAPVTASTPVPVLFTALQRLQQQPDPQLLNGDRDSLLAWAISNWQPHKLAGLRAVPEIAAVANPAV